MRRPHMISAVRPMLVLVLLFTPLFLILAGIWTALDAARRGRNWFAWSVAVSATGVALIVGWSCGADIRSPASRDTGASLWP